MRAFIEAAGANGVVLGLPEVFGALQTGMVDTVIASSIGVLGFQWHTRLKTITKPGGGIVVGAYVIRQDRLDALRAERDEALRLFRDLTPQGSEFQTAEECYAHVRARYKRDHDTILRFKAGRDTAESALAEANALLRRVWPFLRAEDHRDEIRDWLRRHAPQAEEVKP